MKLSILAGATSQTINVFLQDSTSTVGAGKTGLAFNTSSLTAYYALPKAASVSITLATLAAVTSAYSSGGFKEIDSTNMPGWYRLDLPNAAIASGRFVSVHIRGATGLADCPIEIELTGWDNQDGVHGGMSALPNTACTTNASLLTSGTGTAQISTSSGQVLQQAGTGAGQLDFTSGVVKSNTTQLAGSSTAGTNLSAVYAAFETGTAQAGAASTITLRSGASAVNSYYVNQAIFIMSGTGSGQTNNISGYVGATKVATVETTWATTPDNTSVYLVIGRIG